MSMSEFERQLNSMWENDLSSLSTQREALPPDFSDDDKAFVQELDSLFDIHEEEVPPLYVQTLLDVEGPRFQPVENGFEYKTRARVFRRLKLRRRLTDTGRPSLGSLIREMPLRRTHAPTMALILLVFFTVILTSNSFASGMQLLLSGGRAGVMQVHNYPKGVKTGAIAKYASGLPDTSPTLSLQAAQQKLHNWTLYWPHHLPDNYSLSNIYLYQEKQQSWADGPFMELDFALPAAQAHGRGLLAIREFRLKPNVNVLQVVKDGAAQPIKVDQNGQAQAIYVDGQWILRNKIFPTWMYGQRSELIYQQDGIVFWIVGDQRDGIGKDELLRIATSLQVFHVSRAIHVGNDSTMNSVSLMDGDVNSPFTGDVLAIFPDDSNVGPYLTLVGSQSPAPSSTHSRR
ncbi:MAG TPA: hypothetical protein VEU97_04745 [Ktedonobacteraceae bacterium]|nr:hypothetical protein [Ktedonobacteraceae bacterium]